MGKQVYISADYAEDDGDREVVDLLTSWGKDNKHKVNFIDMSQVASGTIANDNDCRVCDLKAEFNRQIKASSAVIFIVGNKTGSRTAGSMCDRANKKQYECTCTPYKQNTNGKKTCKVQRTSIMETHGDFGNINSYSYLQHEFEQAKKKGKIIIIVYNSTRNEKEWLPSYMNGYEGDAHPFWKYDENWNKVGDYKYIKEELGF